ncbi:MAG: hypothetical protein ACK40G_16035 [Cytophagaceae bacterium]
MKWPIIVFCILFFSCSNAQVKKDEEQYLDNPVITDSSAVMMIPVRKETEKLSSKTMYTGNGLNNILIYNFNEHTTVNLFPKETYIDSWNYNSGRFIYYFIKPNDHNKNGRIDNDDPSVLYITDRKGKKMMAITSPLESAVSVNVYEKLGFALIKMQRDKDKNKVFDYRDKDYYFLRLDLDSLKTSDIIQILSSN